MDINVTTRTLRNCYYNYGREVCNNNRYRDVLNDLTDKMVSRHKAYTELVYDTRNLILDQIIKLIPLEKNMIKLANIKNLKPFKPLKSGNPKGRPKKSDALHRVIEEVMTEPGKDGKPAIYNIVQALIRKAENGDVRAAQEILDRYYGKPKNIMDIEANIQTDIAPAMTDEQLKEILEALKPPDNLDS